MFDITFVRYESSKRSMHILFWTAPSIWQRTAERQSLPVTGFLRVIYAILNASVILERNETRLARNEKRLERNETRLARNETRGGNLLLSGTVRAGGGRLAEFERPRRRGFGQRTWSVRWRAASRWRMVGNIHRTKKTWWRTWEITAISIKWNIGSRQMDSRLCYTKHTSVSTNINLCLWSLAKCEFLQV